MTETILRTEHLYKIFSKSPGNENKALELLKNGLSSNEAAAQTDSIIAVRDVSFEVKQGEIFVLIGLSGSGKSTILRCLNMLHRPTAGNIYFRGQNIAEFTDDELLELRRTKISMVFQNFGLMSHRNVLNNVAYGLEVRGVSRSEREAHAAEMLKIVGLEGWERKSIESLSGGMKQRVGIARALASDSEILIMDEAFSALDPLVRNDLQYELLRIQETMNKTIIFITHDINEAFKLGDRVAILRDGSIVQTGSPEEMLTSPADEYVKKFVTNVDTSRIISAKNLVEIPGCIIKLQDGPLTAIRSMREYNVSSAYIVDHRAHFVGIITLLDALAVADGNRDFHEAIISDMTVINNIDVPINDIIPIAAASQFPLPVTDAEGVFQGIISKAAVLGTKH